jgi:hypothetical protein
MITDTADRLPTAITFVNRLLTVAEFHRLSDVPPELEWFSDVVSPNTRWANENTVRDFMRFTGIVLPEEFRAVTRGHIIARRDELVVHISL